MLSDVNCHGHDGGPIYTNFETIFDSSFNHSSWDALQVLESTLNPKPFKGPFMTENILPGRSCPHAAEAPLIAFF